MKKIFFALVVAAAAFSFTGCESKLDIQQKGVIAQENFYKTDEDALSALTSAYYMAGRWFSNSMQTTAGWNDCPWICMWEYASDDMFVAGENKGDGASGNEIQSFRATSNNGTIAGAYEAYYMIINACNLVICNFEALDNVTPQVEVKSKRIGGATFQVPTEIRPDRKESVSMKNIIAFARKRGGKTMADKLASEIMDAFNNQGGAFKRKEDMHRMAEANRAFAHFRF